MFSRNEVIVSPFRKKLEEDNVESLFCDCLVDEVIEEQNEDSKLMLIRK